MKRLILLFVSIIALSCSSDDSPKEVNAMESLKIYELSRHCGNDSYCLLNYQVVNSSSKRITFTTKIVFDRIDPITETQIKTEDWVVFKNETMKFSIGAHKDTKVVSYEILNAEIGGGIDN